MMEIPLFSADDEGDGDVYIDENAWQEHRGHAKRLDWRETISGISKIMLGALALCGFVVTLASYIPSSREYASLWTVPSVRDQATMVTVVGPPGVEDLCGGVVDIKLSSLRSVTATYGIPANAAYPGQGRGSDRIVPAEFMASALVITASGEQLTSINVKVAGGSKISIVQSVLVQELGLKALIEGSLLYRCAHAASTLNPLSHKLLSADCLTPDSMSFGGPECPDGLLVDVKSVREAMGGSQKVNLTAYPTWRTFCQYLSMEFFSHERQGDCAFDKKLSQDEEEGGCNSGCVISTLGERYSACHGASKPRYAACEAMPADFLQSVSTGRG